MCGIAGVLLDEPTAALGDIALSMAEKLRHRGPDGHGVYVDGRMGLAHRRLSIIDPEGGVQPLSNEDGTIWVSFNGEIYNCRELAAELTRLGHTFRTRSDTEVIVHAYEQWGDRCVERLRGMFAFAIWDSPRQRLFLARDRVGIKPLVWFQHRGVFAFASEMQAFEVLPDYAPTLDLQSLDLYLHFQYIPAPYSIYREVRKLPPACTLSVEADGRIVGPTRYWHLQFRPDRNLNENEWCERLDAALRETVKYHLISDVPFGAFLSGGVDSSLVVAYMHEAESCPVKTFSIAFESPEFDESPYAQQVAKTFGTDHHEETVRPDAFGILPELVRHYGEPFADSSAIPTFYVSKLASQHVKMVLSGDGGDENFAGYDSYAGVLACQPAPLSLFRRIRHSVANCGRRLKLWPPLPFTPTTHEDRWFDTASYFNMPARKQLWRTEYHSLLPETRRWFDSQCSQAATSDLCTRYQSLDLANYLPYDILTKVDIASMYHGLEVRVPLLDHVLVELAAQIPVELKLAANRNGNGKACAGWTGKYLLKKTAERFYTRDFLHRRKRGFGVPIQDWFAEDIRSEVESRLMDPSSQLYTWFEPSYIQLLLEQHSQARCHGSRIWSLLFLDEWMNQNTRVGQRI